MTSPTNIEVNAWCCDVPGSPDGECLPYNTDEGLIRFHEGGQLFMWSLFVVFVIKESFEGWSPFVKLVKKEDEISMLNV